MGGGRATGEVLRVAHLDVGYVGRTVVADVNFAVDAGQIVTLIGPNGAGKSTILRTVAGLLAPLAGSVLICGDALGDLPARERARRVSVSLTQRPGADLLTCEDVVSMGRQPFTGTLGVLAEADRACVREAMGLVRIEDLRDRLFSQLSDGQRQRVLLARAICQQPQLMVLDEPTSYLDIRHQMELLGVLRELVATRAMGIVMSLHELPWALRASDVLVCVGDGHVIAQGNPDEIRASAVVDGLYGLEPGVYDPWTGVAELSWAWPHSRDGQGKDAKDGKGAGREGLSLKKGHTWPGAAWEDDPKLPQATNATVEADTPLPKRRWKYPLRSRANDR